VQLCQTAWLRLVWVQLLWMALLPGLDSPPDPQNHPKTWACLAWVASTNANKPRDNTTTKNQNDQHEEN